MRRKILRQKTKEMHAMTKDGLAEVLRRVPMEALVAELRRRRDEVEELLVADGDVRDLEQAVWIVCELWGVRRQDVFSRSRAALVAAPRFAVMALLRQEMGWTLVNAGRAVGRDHGTVVYGLKAVEDWAVGNQAHHRRMEEARRRVKRESETSPSTGEEGTK